MNVRGVLSVSRRVNTGLERIVLDGAFDVHEVDSAWLSLDPYGENRLVNLPDATELPDGWAVVIHHNGSANSLTVRDDGGSTLKVITAPAGVNDTKAYQFVLIDNSTAEGQWKVIELGDPTVDIVKYVETFVEADWSAPAGRFTDISFDAATHGRGVNPMWMVFDDTGSKIYCHDENVDVAGDITLTVTRNDEFDGSIVIF